MLPILPSQTQFNPLIRKHLWGLKMMGFVVFANQHQKHLHLLRGYFFSITFTLFNITQVSFVRVFHKFMKI